MVNKPRLYWTLQIGGWLFYAFVQIGSSVLASGAITFRRAFFLLVESLLCLLLTNSFRIFFNKNRWLHFSMPRLIPRIVISVFVMGLILYVCRMPLSYILGFFDPRIAFNPEKILGLSLVYALIFFLWSIFYFTYHYFERYSTSLKYEASMIEIELNNLRSQLKPHFIFNALNSIRA